MISTCLFIMISLSAVSASESVENQTFSSDNDAINVLGISSNNIISTSMEDVENESDLLANSLSNDNDVLSEGDGGSFSDLNTLINGDTTKTEITLQGDYVFDSDTDDVYSEGILINRPLTINGGGHFIDASNQARIFKITDSVQLINIIFKNANFTGGSGGAIVIDGASDCIVDDCTFINNTAAINGGAIFLDNRASDATIRNSKFYNNTVNSGNGGALDWSAGATNGNVIDSVFENNTAGRSGGAIHWSGHYGTISNTNFTGNKATGDVISDIGGFIGGGDGGAVIWVGSHGIIKDNCNFIDNFAKNRGGAIFLHGNATENCTNTTVTHVNFEDNIAGLNGGAIDWQHGANDDMLSYSNFTNNIAWRSGGAVYWNGIDGTIAYCIFDDNSAIGNVTGHEFPVANYTNDGGHGGAIIWTGSEGYVKHSNFTKNTAKFNGGAVYLQSGTYGECKNTVFDSCIFTENEAGFNGGAVDWYRGAFNGTIINSIFDSNVANRSGGAIHWSGHYGTISNTTFTGNKATGIVISDIGGFLGGGDGGAVVWVGSHGIVDDNCNFTDNIAKYRGGAIFLHGNDTENCTNVTFKDTYFAHNVAGTNGGAIDWFGGAHNGYVENVVFLNNTANRNGGAIFWHGNNGTIKNSKFNNNRATGTSWEYIWAITRENIISYNETHEEFLNTVPTAVNLNKLYVINETLSGNRDYFASYVAVGNETAGYHWEKLDETIISLSESIISPIDWATDQYFGGDGGTILWSGDIGLIENCTFIDSNSARRGGGAYMTGSDYVTFKNCNFTDCTSGTNGGGVDWLAGANYGKIYNCIFNGTRAARSAGAIYYDGDYGEMKNITIINTTSNGGSLKTSKDGLVHYAGWDSSHWDTNTTGGDAGAIMITGDHLYIYNATFTDCISVGRGGAVFLQDNKNATFELCIFEGNYAKGIANNTWTNYTQERNDDNEDTKVKYKLTGHGGAISFDVNAKDSKIINVKFYNNGACRNGGAINFDQGSTNNTIKNSEFINNTVYDDGGAINFDHGADLCTVSNVIFYNNTALGKSGSTSKGGTICLVGNNVTIENSKFTLGNVYADTGAKDNETWGGAMFVTGNYTIIKNTTFENCSALEDGGALYVIGDNCKMYNSSFKNNHAGDDGGAIYWDGNHGFMYNITCSNNTVTGKTKTSAHSKGGTLALTGNNAVVDKSRFELSSAIFDGGAIYATGNYVNITNSEFEKCMVTQGNEANQIYGGGSIFLLGNYSNILNCSFQRSNAKEGGVIYVQGNNANLKGIVTDFTYALDGGAFYIKGANATISESSITRTNATKNYGGSIYVEGVNTVINTTNFTMNFAKTNGGSIYVKGVNATIDSSYFLRNNATVNGGAIYVEGDSTHILNSKVSQSHANENGGGIEVSGKDAYIYGTDIMMTSSKYGGAIYVSGYNATIEKSRFNMTSAAQHGGAIYISGKNALINNSNISMSNASYSGGAVYIQGLSATIENSAFSDTLAKLGSSFTGNSDPTKATPDNTNMGGAIYIGDNYAKIRNSSFTNSAAYYGGILFLQGQFCDVINSSLDKGYSDRDGGAYFSKGINSNVYDSNFTNNVARNDGGALFWLGSQYNYVNGSIFTNNTAKGDPGHSTKGGGAIYFAEGGSYCGISYSKFFNNSAVTNSKADGGAILWDKSSHIFIDHCLFDGNFVNSTSPAGNWIQGGVLYARPGTNLTITNNIFQNCWSLKEAGALYLQTGDVTKGVIELINNTFINNTAYGNTTETDNFLGGGAVLSKSVGKLTIVNATFINNTANYGGGITIHSSVTQCSITNATFDGNKATIGTGCGDGGSIYAKKAFTANNLIMSNGEAARNGGGMYVSNVEMTYNNFTFINNSAANGGGLYWDRAGVTIEDMTFINNSAVISGGAIFIPAGSSTSSLVYVLNNIFTGNSANSGGAIYAIGNSIIISQNNFTNNSASYRGGAIFIPVSNNGVDIGYSNFTGNKAAADGGAIFIGSKGYDNRKIHDCNFINNSAVDDGGAIYVANINKEIINCYFDGNKADGDGGAVYVAAVQGGKITDSTFTNSLAQNGGAVYYAGTTNVAGALKIVNDTFLKNIAIYNGGAVLYLVGNGPDKYRDYNNFDGIGIPVDGGRTTVKANNTNVEFISTSLFEDNEDYMLRLRVISDWLNPYITIYIDNPRDWNRYGLRVVMKLINSTTHEEIRTIIINESNINTHRRDGMIYASFGNLIKNETYNITVSFEDYNYLYKVNSTVAQAHGEIIGEFKLLQKLIDEAIDRGDKELVLNRTFTFTPFYEGKHENMDDRCINLTNIPYAFTIRGEGFVIDAAGYSRIFNITSSNVTIDNVILVGGNASGEYGDGIDMGGAIFWAGPNGIISNSIIEHNNATIGGGIYYNVTAPDCQIINTTFVENTAVTHGGAIDCNTSRMGLFNTTFDGNFAYIGAALCREINATEGHGKNNTFIGNYAEYAGAALAWINATRISIDDYHFYNNHVGYSGGAIYVGEGSKNCEILNCIFDNNWVENETDGHGGAIEWYSEKGLVYNSEFTNNRAYDGGAIYVGSASGEINITKSTFHDNIAVTTGGAISINASAVTVNASNFYNNNATRGGALFVGGVGTDNYIYGSVFEGNNAISTTETAMNGLGGAIDWVASSGTIVDTRFTDNHADYGGGVYFGENSINSRIDNCLFEGNDAKYNGGAIDCNASSMYLTNTVFDGNVAQFGAALCRETNVKSGSGANNTFKNNHAIVVGAALGWMGSVGITIKNYTFINNSADVAGGAIYVSPTSHNCSVIDCNFEDNYVTNITNGWVGGEQFTWTAWDGTDMTYVTEWTTDASKIATADVLPTETIFYYNTQEDIDNALGNGGAITIYGANATVENTNFTGSSARLGGAIYVGATSGHTILNHTIFTSNVALERGGAVNLHASGVHIDDGKFYDNLAVNGSAIYVGGLGTENKVHESIFRGNNATDYGGAIYWVAYVGEIYNSEFTQNNARWGGGIYFNGNSANTNVVNSTFKSNSAVKNGGAIECNASNIGIDNLTFEENIAGEYGAALCRESGATYGHGTNNTFIRNHAGISGAALAWMGVTDIHIVDYKFIDNTAETSGGAIFINKGSNNDIIENCTFEGNHLTNLTEGHNGGAIDCRGENLTIDYVDFTNNGAYTGGAVYMASDSKNIRIFDSNFTSNYAMGDGGALGLKAESLVINNTIFKSNTAVRHGGALYAGGNGTNNTIRYTTFEDNRAGDHGGAIDWLASAAVFEYINFIKNTAEYGGGIYLNGVSSNSRLNSVYFRENSATKNGGAIDCNASMMGLNNTIFESNHAGEYGAALCREANATGGFGGNNSFIKNHAEIAGAALAWLSVDGININNYKFINNTADLSGGAIYVRGDSPNCKVRNSYFENNRVNDVQNGQGGAIDWLGENGYIYNSTFKDSFAHTGGTLFVSSNNMNITLSNFTGSRALGEGGVILLMSNNTTITDSKFEFSVALERGGVISAYDAYNATISDCKFDSNVAAGYIDSSDRYYGDGGTISWINGNNLKIINSEFNDTQAHAYGGSLYIVNVNDSSIFNSSFKGMLAVQAGGTIYWVNSTNVTIDLCNITSSSASYNGGAIYLENISDTRIINSNFDDVSTPRGNGGVLFIAGNVTMYNDTFNNFKASTGNAGAIFFGSGNSSLSNSSFDGIDAIWINKGAIVKMTKNNITADIKNKNTTYLTTPYDVVTNPVPYSVWNDGNLTLDKNNFDCVIFNDEGIIDSPTVIKILDNTTVYADWNSNFTFWASIYDDNNNTIISVSKLNTTNDVVGGWYPMSYNAWSTQVYYKGTFHISGKDVGLPNAVAYNGTLNVLVETTLPLDVKQVNEGEHVTITATVPQDPNTITGNVTFVVNGETYIRELVKGIATLDLYNLTANTYHVTATYSGDKNHFECQNTTQFIVNLRDTWVIISIQNYTYGILGCANVTSNGNGTIRIYFNGRYEDYQLVNGTFNLTFDQILNPGLYWMSVTYIEDGYYKYAMNQTSFEVYTLNTTINATPTNITYGQDEIINVTVNETAEGYIAVTIGDQIYVAIIHEGFVQFKISGLAAGIHTAVVTFPGDNHFNRNSTTVQFKVNSTSNYIFNVTVEDIVYGDNATVRVLLNTSATGTVSIYVNGTLRGTVQLVNGEAILRNIDGLEGGKYVVNVTYSGDSTFTPGYKNNTNFTVSQRHWEPSITQVDYRPYGEYTTINVTNIPNLKSRTIVIQIDGINYICNIVDGRATLRLNNLSAGTHNGLVLYPGDVNYQSLHKVFRPTIPQATPTITLTQDEQNNKNVIATVSGNATGKVTFFIGDKSYQVDLYGRTAVLEGKLDYGTNVVSATYGGDQNYTKADARATFEVPQLPSLVNVTVSDTEYGNPVEIIVQVGEGQIGSVKIEINGNTYMSELENEQAKFYINGLNVNQYTVNVTYNGDHAYSSNKNSTKFNVTKAELSVDVTALDVTVEDNITFIINVLNSDFAGKVNITVIDGINYDGDVKTLIVMNKLPVADKYTAEVTFYGDNNYKNKTMNIEFTISRVTPTIDVTIDNVIYPNKAIAVINITNKANGTVNVTVDGQTFTETVLNGQATVELTGDHAGPKEAFVEFFTTDNYNNNVTASARFTVNKASSAIRIIVDEIYKVGEDIVITLEPVNSTGDITVTINGESKDVDHNQVTITGGLAEGTYTIIANLAANDNYDSVTNSTTFNVVENTIELDLDVGGDAHVGDDREITVTLNVTDATGNIIFSVNNVNYVAPIVGNVSKIVLRDLENITYTIKASYNGDAKYFANESGVDSFNVSKNAVSIRVDVHSPITLGETTTATINMNPLINTTVRLTVGNATYNKTYNVVVINGVGTYDLFGFENEGTYDVNVSFAGDKKYLASNNSTQLVVNKVSDYDLDVYVSDITFGSVETILVVLPSDADTTKLIVNVSGTVYPHIMTNGFATVTVPGLAVGRYEVNVTYLGDDKYGRKENNSNFFNVTQGAGYAIVITVDNQTYGQYTTINVKVPNNVVNNVTIVVDGVSYSRKANDQGIATLSLNNLTGGLHLVTAIYPGDTNWNHSSNSTVFTVDRNASTIDVNFTTPVSAGVGVLFNVSMGQKINGSAILTVGDQIYNVVLTNGNGSYVVYGLMNGNYDVKVEFGGNENYTNSSSSVKTLVVSKTTTTVSLSDAIIEVGQVATLLITVTDGATGIVNVTVNGITQSIGLIDSKATVYVPDLINGTYSITVKYGGDDKHNASENITQHIYVNKVSVYDFYVVASDTVVGESSIVTVYMPGDANGNITIGSKTAKVVGGKAVIVLDKETTAGEKSVTVTYGNDTKYADNTVGVIAKYNVDKAPSSVNIAVNSIYVIGDTVTITLTPVNGTATVKINDKDYAVTNNQVTFEANVTGPYTVVASIAGNDSYYGSSDTKVFNIVKASSSIAIDVKEINKVGETIVITLIPNNSTGDISVTINGVPQIVTTVGTDKKVYVGDLAEGTYTIVANLAGDDKYESSTAFKVFNVVKKNLTVTLSDVDNIEVGSPRTFTATLNESAKGDVIFNINGVNYIVSSNVGTTTYNCIYTPVNNATLYVVATFMGNDEYNVNSSALKSFEVSRVASEVILTDVRIEVDEIAVIKINVTDGATGTVNVTVNGTTYSVGLVGSKATVLVSGLTYGTHPITVKYLGDDKYNPSDNSDYNVYVNKISDYEFYVVASDTVVGGNSIVTVYLPGDADGNITIGTKTAKVEHGVAVIVLDKETTAGEKHKTVTYGHDSKYADKTGVDAAYNVDKAPSSVKISVKSLYIIDETVEITLTTVNGTATVKINNVDYAVTDNKVTFIANVTGQYTVVANITGNDSYYGSIDTKVFDIIKAPSSIGIVGVEDVYKVGENIIITLTPSNADGDVNVTVDGQSYRVEHNIVTITGGLAEGTHTIVANLSNTSKYEASSNVKVFNVIKNDLTIVVNDVGEDIYVDSKVEFNATLGEKVTGDVIFNINGINYTAHVNDAKVATYEYTPVNNATLTVVATFVGNDKYNSKTSDPRTFDVNRVASTVDLTDVLIEVGETAVININVTDGATGVVNVTVNGKTYSVGLVGSKAKVYISELVNTTYPITVKYLGDDKYAPSENITQHIYVNKISSYDFYVVASDTIVGGNSTVTVYMPSDADGNITIGTKTAKVVDGKAVIVLDKETRAVENKEVTVTYGHDSKYADKTGADTYNVGKAPSSVEIKVGSLYVIGDTVEINLTAVNGTPTVNINGQYYTVTDNKVTFTANVTGPYIVVANIAGDDDYSGSSDFKVFNIIKASSSISIIDVKDIYKVGEEIVITLIPENSTGKISVTINGESKPVDDNNQVTITGGLPEGTYTIIANLPGDNQYGPSTTFKVFKVVKNNITIAVNRTTVPSMIIAGTEVTFTANLNETVTGDVIFTINGANYTVHIVNANNTTYKYTPVNNETLTVVATFAGNDMYNSNVSAPEEFDVNRIATSINVAVINNPVTYGNAAVIAVTMDSSINATVKVKFNGKYYDVAVVNGEGKLNVSGLNADSYGVNVTYAGDDRYAPSINDTVSFTVVPADLTAEVIGLNVTVSDNTKFIINVTEDFKGNVRITDEDGKELYDGAVKTIVDGAIVPTAGDKKATAVFYDDDNYNELTVNDVDFTVSTEESAIIVNVTEVTYPNTPIAKVNISNKANGTVNITIDGESFIKEITNGYVEIPLEDLNAGFKNATVKFISTDGYNSNMTVNYKFVINQADSHIDINITPEMIYVGGKAFLNITVSCTGEVKIYVDGKEYIKTLDENNKVYVTTDSLSAGEHTVYVYYPGDVNYKDSSAVKTFTVLEGNFIVNSTGFEYVTLAEAVAASNGTDTIIARPGTYTGEGNVGVEISGKNLTITGTNVIFDAENADVNILTVAADANVTLVGLTYANVRSTDKGAVVNNGNLTVMESEFVNNTAASGGAIYSIGALTVEGSEFINNTATSNLNSGGAIYYHLANGEFNVIDSTFIGNDAAGKGGAIFVGYGLPTVKGSEFYNNTATANGGAICFWRAVGEIDGSYFENNTAVKSPGGAINLAVGGTVNNSEFVDNHAFMTNGAAITAGGSNIYIANSNFTGINLIDIMGTATLENNVELSAKVIDGYSVRLSGLNAKLTLIKNNFNTTIVNIVASGAILSEVNITVLDNKTWDTTEGSYTLYATITDDNGNWIKDTFARFTVNGAEVPAIAYDDSTGLYTAEFTLTGDRLYEVGMTRYADEYINIGILRNITGTFTELQKLIDEATDFVILDHNFAYDPVIDGEIPQWCCNR